MNRVVTMACAVLSFALFVGCTATQQGAVAGTAVGAGAGAIIGNQSGDAGEGALIGGALGAVSGALIGHGIDKSKEPAPAPVYQYENVPSAGAPPASSGVVDVKEANTQGQMWVPEHEEIHIQTAPDGTTYEQRVLVPGHYE